MTNAVPARPFLSIGEVLDLLKEEFADITISKIRFLESQGLLDPERTPSGYRKFHDPDVERLRWILRQQRENFLPLKVIKERISRGEDVLADEDVGSDLVDATDDASDGADGTGPPVELDMVEVAAEPAAAEEPGPLAEDDPTADVVVPDVLPGDATSEAVPEAVAVEPGDAEVAAPAGDPADVSMTRDELLAASGLTPEALGQLATYGLLVSRRSGGETYFDGDALAVARTAAAFAEHGVEARHLRMFLVAVDREASIYGQLLLPLLRSRSTSARTSAITMVQELGQLGEQLRGALLRQAVRELTDPG